MRVQHVVAKHAFEVGDQMTDAVRLEKRKRLAVDLQNPDMAGTDAQPGCVFVQESPEIANAKRAPFFELLAQTAIILKPQGNWRKVKNIGAVAQGRLDIHGFPALPLASRISETEAFRICVQTGFSFPIGKSRDGLLGARYIT